jgi:hypothetical protein|tara:strand:+ start:1407 stop:1808 length:402 start_codon:yes stop_codon:yes gene_type:complete
MKQGDKVTMKSNTLIMGYHRGGAYFRIAKRGTPKLSSRRAGTFSRNKYHINKGITGYTFMQRGAHHSEIQCYGEQRFEPGDVIGEVMDIQDTHIDIVIDSTTFSEPAEVPFRIVTGIELDKNAQDAFEVLSED